MRWVFRIIIILVLLAMLAFCGFIWLAQALALQNQIEDNLTLLRRDLILNDRNLSFSYQRAGVEMKGLSPAMTLVQPMLIYKKDNTEYRFTVPELSFVGGFTSNQIVSVTVSDTIQMTEKLQEDMPINTSLIPTDSIELNLIGSEGEGHLWQQFQLASPVDGTLRLERNDEVIGRLSYQFPKFPPSAMPRQYSSSLQLVIGRIHAKEGR